MAEKGDSAGYDKVTDLYRPKTFVNYNFVA